MQTTNISLIFLVLVALVDNLQSCLARDTITFNSLLPDDGTTLISSGKRFELGFFSPEDNANTGRYVGIWYYNSSPRTVVWIANRDAPLLHVSGYFAIVEDGNLKLLDGKGASYFHTNLGSSSAVNRTLKLLDSGNLALIDGKSGNYLWQSFAEPTDTLLPGMRIDGSLKLVSWRDTGNPAAGNFTFQQDQESRLPKIMNGLRVVHWKSDQSGSVVLPYFVAFFLSNFSRSVNQATYKSSSAYPSINPGKGLRNPSTLNYSDALASYANTRLLMNSSGQIQFYSLEQDGWSLTWSEPHDACSVYNPCGNFGSCNLRSEGLNCDCLPGFNPIFPDAWNTGDFSGGCDRKLAICSKTSKPDTFLNLKLMKVGKPDILSAGADSEDTCRQECLRNCDCQAYYYAGFNGQEGTDNGGSGCLIWTSVLTNLQEEYIDGGHNLSVRVAVSSIETTTRDCQTCGTYIVPYPLSTGPNCGDPSYYSFFCDDSTGQLFFLTSNNRYEVISINKDESRFTIQVKSQRAENCSAISGTLAGRVLQLNQSLPFDVMHHWCYYDRSDNGTSIQSGQRLQISWKPPLEPICSSSNECQDWPDSNCAATTRHEKRCLCNSNYKWDNQALKCISAILTNPNHSEGTSLQRDKPHVAVIIVTPVIAVVLLAGSLICFCLRKRILAKRKEDKENIPMNLIPYPDDSERQSKDLVDETDKFIDVPYFSLESILAATNNFSDTNKLGRGGFGPVYKGIFPGEKEIAVKRLSSHSGQGMKEFQNEVVLIAKLQHRNLVRLLGYCIKGSEKILLYEYLPNKSLDTFIFDQGLCILLDWKLRFNIILGIARGLLYLHQDSRLRIIHRDLKTSNILLDKEMNPKISDFGLAKIVQGKETEANTIKVVGTYGYMSPEYAVKGFFSVKSDVFSFGVILLEIISGKRNSAGFYQSEGALSLLGYAWRLWQERKSIDFVDKKILESCNETEVIKCINIGLLCVQDDPSERPTMSEILIMLSSETTALPSPNQPAFVVRRHTSKTPALSRKEKTNSFNEITISFLSCVAMDNITSISRLQDDGSTLMSAGKIFELGFFSPDGNDVETYLGIWYYLRKTVVWVANRDKPILHSYGYLSIGEDGNLKLLDEMGTSYFNTTLESSSPVNRMLKLLDSGNLVLIDGSSGNILWQSFAEPTDTFLPGMSMDKGLKLVSWWDSGNPKTGNFTFEQDQENRLYRIMERSTVVHWESDQSGSIDLPYFVAFLLSNFSPSLDRANYKPSNAYKTNIYKWLREPFTSNYSAALAKYANTRLLMNSSGEIQFYIKEEGVPEWLLVSSEPQDACKVHLPCGNFGSCNLKNGGRSCECLLGFEPVHPDTWNTGDFKSGCRRTLEICNPNTKPHTFLNLKLMKAGKPDFLAASANSENLCRQGCLSNCNCLAYYFGGPSITDNLEQGCSMWTSVLTDLQEDIDRGHNLSFRVAVSAIETTSRDCQTCGKHIIPYPLSTGPNCGDLSYHSFTCNDSRGQLFFLMLNNSYEVININKEDRRFVIQVNRQRAENCDARSGRVLQFSPSMPFNVTNWCYNEPLTSIQMIEITWKPPPEPICNSLKDCRGWPDSNCSTAIDKRKRCLCNPNYKWNNLKCISAIVADSNRSEQKPQLSVNRIAVIISGLAIAIVMLACSLCFVVYRRRILANRKESRKSIAGNPVFYLDDSETQAADLVVGDDKIVDVPYFSMESILAATDNFSDTNKLGSGGFGPVYKGMFPGETEIAVKRLSSHSGQGLEEFRNEVVLIAKLQHRNLVRLLGYCIQRSEKILLYEYMPNKSLDTFIFDQSRCILLNWNLRFNIILGIARGLLYLHQDSRLRIIHRDLKTGNILLDEEMNPKISDFGLARIVQGYETEANTQKVVGTYGYMSPEYALEGLFSVKSDVYSFGVVLLEIIGGKRNTTGFYRSEEVLSLLGYAWRLWQENKAMDLVDKKLLESCNGTEVVKCINIGLLCVQDDPSDRPTMSNVLTMLSSETTTLPSPNQPTFLARRRTSSTSLSSKAETNSINEITISAEEGR
ncbi:uncharacterized protein [Coffea arabica]|uniref:non-specific serine/threonine protein kinase n=1 Tax=Coffea arabica TaxID=13443 RepID=A0ABM4UC63_COFAR